MSCESESMQSLRQSGHKPTPQRALILSALRHADGHVTAATIHERVRLDYPYVDISTVYRTLSVLKELRLVTETDLGAGDAVYEWIEDEHRHHHLICQRCGSMASLEGSYLEQLRKTIVQEHDFQPDMSHFAIFGLCQQCAGTDSL